MKKVLASFLSVVMSRISFVMFTRRPETGGIRRKSRILKRRTRHNFLSTEPVFSHQVTPSTVRCRCPSPHMVKRWLKELQPQLDPKCVWRLQTPQRNL